MVGKEKMGRERLEEAKGRSGRDPGEKRGGMGVCRHRVECWYVQFQTWSGFQ